MTTTTIAARYEIPTVSPSAALRKRLEIAIQERDLLENQIRRKLETLKDTNLLKLTRTILAIEKLNIQKIHELKAHTWPVKAIAWSKDSDHIVSVADDNNLIVWNSKTKLKEYFEPLQSEDEYVFACDMSPDNSLILCGGLNNHVSVFRVSNNNSVSASYGEKTIKSGNLAYGQAPIQLETRFTPSIVCRFKGHDDCITGTKFINNSEIVSSSNDRRCILWDINKGTKSRIFGEHLSDVTSISLAPSETYNPNLFLTSSASESIVRLFDLREHSNGGLVEHFGPVGDDATVVEFSPSGKAFAVGTKESVISLYDIRAGSIKLEEYILPISSQAQQQLSECHSPTSTRFESKNANNFANFSTEFGDSLSSDRVSSSGQSASRRASYAAMYVDGVESLSFSNSGRILFCCTQDMGCFAFDVLKGKKIQDLDNYSSAVEVSPDGYTVLTASNPSNNMDLWTFV